MPILERSGLDRFAKFIEVNRLFALGLVGYRFFSDFQIRSGETLERVYVENRKLY